MRKLLIILALILLPSAALASVWQYGSYQERAQMAAECGLFGYRGTYAQNTDPRFIDCFKKYGKSNLLGFSVITRYKTNLSSSMTSNQSTVPVSSMSTFDGHTITMTDVGDKVFLSLEPGSSREEIVMCTGITGTTWTGCTRGLAFYGNTTTAVAANQFAHNAGSVVVMSNVQYVYNQYLDITGGTQTINGVKTFASFPVIATSTAIPTSNSEFATKYYVDTVGAGGFTALNVSTTRGLSVDGSSPEKVGVNTHATSGLEFNSSGQLQVKVNSSTMYRDANGIGVDTAQNYTWTGTQTFNGTTTFSSSTVFNGSNSLVGTTTFTGAVVGGTKFGGTGADGDLTITSTTSTINLGGLEYVEKNYDNISITGTGALNFSNPSTNGTIIVFKVKNNVVITSTASVAIDLRSLGASTTYKGVGLINQTNYGNSGSGTTNPTGGAGINNTTSTLLKGLNLYVGAGGGKGKYSAEYSDGGIGGGALYLEVNGSLNFSGVINAVGGNGTTTSGGGAADISCGGGGGSRLDGGGTSGGQGGTGGPAASGGGGGGVVVISYNNLIANSGTISISGGSGVNTTCVSGDGGNGYSAVFKNNDY